MDSLEPHQMSMNRLGPLFTHQACTDRPPLHPWYDMVFQDVHLGQYRSLGEGGSVIVQKFDDVLVCNYKPRKNMAGIKERYDWVKLAYLTLLCLC